MANYYHTKLKLEDVPEDLLLTEAEIKKSAERALKNPSKIPVDDSAACWPINCPQKKCGLLQWIMGKCCECGPCLKCDDEPAKCDCGKYD